MNEHFHGKGLARLAVLFPWALPTALNALIWRWMYNSDYGLFNSVILQAGLAHRPINWLGDTTLAMVSMVIVAVWKTQLLHGADHPRRASGDPARSFDRISWRGIA